MMNHQQLLDNRLHIGQRIAELRQEKGFTQQDLADRTGILRSNIARMEAGKRNISIDLLGTVLQALGHKIDFSEISATELHLQK